jgi:hypothetical protein
MAVAMAHLSLTRVPLVCTSQSGVEASASDASHGEMSMPDGLPGNGHEEGAPSSQPCDHSGVPSACVTMTSCVSTVAEPQQATHVSAATSVRVFVGAVTEPASPTLSLDTPPPRA